MRTRLPVEKELKREEIRLATEEFLRNGGKVEVLATGPAKSFDHIGQVGEKDVGEDFEDGITEIID